MNKLSESLKKIKGIFPDLKIVAQEPGVWVELYDFPPSIDGTVNVTAKGNIVYQTVALDSPEGICNVNVGL